MTERFALWPNGTFCDEEDIEAYLTFMSDDFRLVSAEELQQELNMIELTQLWKEDYN
jgi:hypothetical protein